MVRNSTFSRTSSTPLSRIPSPWWLAWRGQQAGQVGAEAGRHHADRLSGLRLEDLAHQHDRVLGGARFEPSLLGEFLGVLPHRQPLGIATRAHRQVFEPISEGNRLDPRNRPFIRVAGGDHQGLSHPLLVGTQHHEHRQGIIDVIAHVGVEQDAWNGVHGGGSSWGCWVGLFLRAVTCHGKRDRGEQQELFEHDENLR